MNGAGVPSGTRIANEFSDVTEKRFLIQVDAVDGR